MDTKQFYRQLQTDAETMAQKAMDVLASMQGKETVAVQKDAMDFSTSADIAAEKCIVDCIQEKYPKHSIYSEEMGLIQGTDSFRWVIDPLDQTKEYSRGLSEYNCLIAVEQDGKVICGVSQKHGIPTVYASSLGNGASCNDEPIHVSPQSTLQDAFIGFNLPNLKNSTQEIDRDISILKTCIPLVYRIRPFWDQAKVMGWVAQGILDGTITPPHVCKWYDVASSIILVEEAGGKITDWYGNPVTEQTYTNGILASNSIMHDQLLGLIQKSDTNRT